MSQSESNPVPPSYNYENDEISLKEFILRIQDYCSLLWSKKVTVILVAILSSALFLGLAQIRKTTYTSGISFMVTDNNNSQQRNLRNTFGNLEFGFIENNKITELARSGRILHQVLLNKAAVNNREDFIANHIIDIYELHEKWNKEPTNETYSELHLKNFYFVNDDISQFSKKELRALSIIHELVSGNRLKGKKGIMSITYIDETDIFRLNVTTLDETLALQIIEEEFRELKEFYIGGTINKTKTSRDLVANETDSLYNALINTERQLAYGKDRNRAISSSLQGLKILNQEREAVRLDQEYNESLRRLKNLEILLNSETPEFQIIDQNFFPVVDAPSNIISIVLGGFIGGSLASLFLIARKIIRDALSG